MLRLKQALGACMLVCALLPTVEGCQHYFAVAHAATYYVATTGSNSHPGTEAKPWRTVAYAVSQMVAGDTTYVRGGTYVESFVRFSRSGTQLAPIKLLNYPGESPVIDCVDGTTKKLKMILIQNASGERFTMGWITIEGFEIKRCTHGLKAYNIHDSTFRHNWIHDNDNNGMLLNGSARILIDRNRINHNGALTKGNGHGLYINGSSHIVTNNLFYDSSNYGIQINGTFTYGTDKIWAGPEFAESNDWIIANNTFAYSRFAPAMVIWGTHANNTRIENNIFYENAVHGTSFQGINFVSCCSTGIQIRNNLAYASGSKPTGFIDTEPTEGVHYTQSDNIVNTFHPKFVNAPATLPSLPNFALSAQSPAIDKGLPPSDETRSKTLPTAFDNALFRARRIDFAGTARPKGRAYDIGAYEYNADGDSQAPVQVQDLQLH